MIWETTWSINSFSVNIFQDQFEGQKISAKHREADKSKKVNTLGINVWNILWFINCEGVKNTEKK